MIGREKGMGTEVKGKEKRTDVLENSRKPRFLTNFSTFGAPVPAPSPIWAKFGMHVQANGVLFHANFIVIGIYYYV